jgi:hypothetical protein
MQAFKLVNDGFVDKVIVFDSLPERLWKNVRTRDVSGFPRAWARWLLDIGSTRPVYKTETFVDVGRNYTYKHTPIGKEPCFFVLEYEDINQDKEIWHTISEYVRMNVGPEVRLREKLEDMALSLANKPTDALMVEPEEVPVIPVPLEVEREISSKELIKANEPVIVHEDSVIQKKRGRPKKAVAVGV